MTYTQAVTKARKLAKQNGCEYFVVEEFLGEIDVCNELTLDTYYYGIPETRIRFCTSDY